MTPVTRSRHRRDSIPLAPVLEDPNSPRSVSGLPLAQQEDTTPLPTPSKPKKQTAGTGKHPSCTGIAPLLDESINSSADSDSDSDNDDDEAPEAVSLHTGRENAKRAQDEAKRAVEAQEQAARKKRKARDAKLKEQKEEANERKRRKVGVGADDSKELTVAEKTEPAEGKGDEEGKEEEIIEPKSTGLLPESLLAQVATLPKRHREEEGSGSESEEETKGGKNVAEISSTMERNRRRKLRKKLNKTLKRGPVNVKVLKDDTKSRKILPPPAAKIVGSIKNSWLFGRSGGVQRRDVVSGFVRR